MVHIEHTPGTWPHHTESMVQAFPALLNNNQLQNLQKLQVYKGHTVVHASPSLWLKDQERTDLPIDCGRSQYACPVVIKAEAQHSQDHKIKAYLPSHHSPVLIQVSQLLSKRRESIAFVYTVCNKETYVKCPNQNGQSSCPTKCLCNSKIADCNGQDEHNTSSMQISDVWQWQD